MDTMWPTGPVNYRALDGVFFFGATAFLAAFLSRRGPSSFASFKTFTLARWVVTTLLVDSLLFVSIVGIVLFGVGTGHTAGCSTAVWLCITAYAISKLLIYFFLVERAFIVWSAESEGAQSRRVASPIYRVAFVCLFLWLGTLLAMVFGRLARFRAQDGACEIGLRIFATVPLLVVDAIVNIGLTSLFLIPLSRSRFSTSRRLAYRSALAAVGALVTSAANLILVATMGGHQLSWVCLSSCSLDVTLNACIIFWITSGDQADPMLREASNSVSRPSFSCTGSARGSFLGAGKRMSSDRSRQSFLYGSSPFAKDYRPTSPHLADIQHFPSPTRPMPVAGRVSFSLDGGRKEVQPVHVLPERGGAWDEDVEGGQRKKERPPSLAPSIESV